MRILPTTAAAKPMSVTGVATDANRNVQAGAAYMRYLIDVYIGDEPSVNERNRMLFAYAAYHAEPAGVTKFRRLASQEGSNPNVWFGNVEHAADPVVGIAIVRYVSNIYKYYIAYTLAAEREAAANAAREQGVGGSAAKQRAKKEDAAAAGSRLCVAEREPAAGACDLIWINAMSLLSCEFHRRAAFGWQFGKLLEAGPAANEHLLSQCAVRRCNGR